MCEYKATRNRGETFNPFRVQYASLGALVRFASRWHLLAEHEVHAEAREDTAAHNDREHKERDSPSDRALIYHFRWGCHHDRPHHSTGCNVDAPRQRQLRFYDLIALSGRKLSRPFDLEKCLTDSILGRHTMKIHGL